MSPEILFPTVLLIALGAIAGVLAGLLGIGGGAVLVPGMYYILLHFGYTEHAMHIAVGTSLLTIIFTGTSSAISHHKIGGIDKGLFINFLPGILIGTIVGSVISNFVSGNVLKLIFAISQLIFGCYFLLKQTNVALFKTMPRRNSFTLIASLNACISTLMGVGGGVQNVTFMLLCNVAIKKAVAVAAALGPVIAVFGSVGFSYIGFNKTGLPPYSFGYINLAMFLCIILSSICTAPLGAKLAHAVDASRLKRYFSVFMLFLAGKMLLEVI